jgi:hypothetical protein
MNGKGAFTSDRFNFGGGEYTFNDKRTQVGVWYAELSDIYQQQYFNLSHSQPLGDWTLGANLGYFIGKEDGSARPATWTTKPRSPCSRPNTAATPSMSACRNSRRRCLDARQRHQRRHPGQRQLQLQL